MKFFNSFANFAIRIIMGFKLKSICLLLFIIGGFVSNAQYSISVHIEGYQDTALLMTSYYGDKVRLIDTAYASSPGKFKFEGKEDLPGGIYMAVSISKSKLFEFVVDKKQKFSLSTDTVSYSLNMKVNGSEENEIFYNYLHLNEKLYTENNLLSQELTAYNPGDSEYLKIKARMDSVNNLSSEFKLKVMKEKPGLLVSSLFRAMQPVEIPDSILLSSDSLASYFYYKKHFFDNMNLSDERLLRTPLISKKTNEYFNNLVIKQPDSAIIAIDFVIARARPSEEVVGYLVWYYTAEYQNPEYMGFDKVFVHLVDNYFSKEQIINTTPSILKSLQDRANLIRPTMIGEPAQNLILVDTAGNYRSWQNIDNEYIIIYFWDYDCGICKAETIELQKIYKKIWYDFEVYGVCVNADLDAWKKAVVDKKITWVNVNGTRSVTPDFHDLYDISGTPAIFILDKERKIIAKQLAAKQILPFLEKYSKIKTDNP